MAYSTVLDMVDTFGWAEMRDLTDIGDTPTNDVVPDVLNKVLADASAMIDGYLVGRYQLPLAAAPEVLRLHCRGIARYLLMTKAPDERAKLDFNGAVQYLQRVASGAIALLPPATPGVQPAGMGAVVFEPGQKVFARGAD